MRKYRQARLWTSAGLMALAVGAVATQAQAQTEAAPAPHFMIRAFEVKGNHLLPAGDVEDIIYPFMGPDKTPDDVEKARAALQAAYEKGGYATVSVFIPDQAVDTGVIRLEVQSQVIGQVTVSGGKRTSTNWVIKRAPSLASGGVPNFHDVQKDVVALNTSADRRVTPDVKAGAAPGTVDVNLKVEDTLPLHGSLELNNENSAETTDLRVTGTLRYDDLWGRGDSLSVTGQTAPSRTKDGTVFSGNYLTHIGSAQALVYYINSNSDIAVVGGTTVVGKGDMIGGRFILPLSQSEKFYQSLTLGFDYKDFGEDVKLGDDRSSAPISYLPFTAGWRGDWNGDKNKSYISVSTTFGIRGIGDDQGAFDNKRFDAKPNFFYVRGDAASTQDIIAGFQLYGHLSGQYSAAPLISNEQFSVGGADTVRGYYESEALGDYGWAYQFEARTPPLFASIHGLDELRVLGFVDDGYAGIHDPLAGQLAHYWLASAGLGLRLKAYKYINGSLDVGAPIIDGPDSKAGDVFARFRIWGEF